MDVREGGPSALLLSRQGLPFVERDQKTIDAIAKGGYILREADGQPQAVIIATGSEVGAALQAQEQLQAKGGLVRGVSMPCTERFEARAEAGRAEGLPPQSPNVAVGR